MTESTARPAVSLKIPPRDATIDDITAAARTAGFTVTTGVDGANIEITDPDNETITLDVDPCYPSGRRTALAELITLKHDHDDAYTAFQAVQALIGYIRAWIDSDDDPVLPGEVCDLLRHVQYIAATAEIDAERHPNERSWPVIRTRTRPWSGTARSDG